jgi:hypothetical protein
MWRSVTFFLYLFGMIGLRNTSAAFERLQPDPLMGHTICSIIANVITTLQPAIISITVFLAVLGGITLLTSAGNEERVKKGKKILVWAGIGLFVVLSAPAIKTAIEDALDPAAGGGGGPGC